MCVCVCVCVCQSTCRSPLSEASAPCLVLMVTWLVRESLRALQCCYLFNVLLSVSLVIEFLCVCVCVCVYARVRLSDCVLVSHACVCV